MKFIQVEKSREYIFTHLDEDLHLITCVYNPEKVSGNGHKMKSYTSFKTKTLSQMTLEEIDEAIKNDNTVLIKIERESH